MPQSQGAERISDAEPSPFETVPPGEAAAIAAVVQAIEAQVRAGFAKTGHAIRDAHPKMHGCVFARLEVSTDLPADLRRGLFAEPGAYDAWVRFSNGSGTPQKDEAGDGRGMAVKVLGVAGSPSGTQDFVMINHPAFFVRNAADYVDFSRAKNPLGFFFPSFNPFRWRLHELFTARAITQHVVSNPLDAQYYSMAPLLFGDIPCKVSARPVGPASAFADRTGDDFLRANLVKALGEGDKVFELCVQRQADPAAMPVEDPTIPWPEDRAPFMAVARLTIPRQVFATPEQDAFGENLSFTPWHGLAAHRPLGGINRVRREVYETISTLRHELNGATGQEPT